MNSSIFTSALRKSLRPRSRTPWTSNWVCNSCRSITSPRFSSTTMAKEKPYYVTTPIFYVNAAPHIGHLYTMVLADTLKRWQVLRGKQAILCTGTDEHGMKIQQAASKARLPPKEFCDSGAEVFKTLARSGHISNDHFVRTTDDDHRDAVQHIWFLLEERGYIYQSKHEGWYCVSDETFYPESAIEKRLDPFTGKTFMASSETGKEVEWTSEANYHFRLSEFKEPLLQFYKDNPDFIVPASRMKDVVRAVSEDLKDLSISRPLSRLSWGIPVPNDPSQTIYVWLDALINYITKAGYPWAPGCATAKGWPADIQVIGKDIVRFHCIYWPAFLLALNLPLPKQILTHAHWTMQNQKMSKSIGNVVNPFFAIERFGVDTMRFYLMHDGGIGDDSDYGNHFIVERYKKGLMGGLGNLVSRTLRPKSWNVRSAVDSADSLHNLTGLNMKQSQVVRGLRGAVEKHFENLDPGAALREIMNVVYITNKYMQDSQPWKLIKSPTQFSAQSVKTIIYHISESLRIIGILLQPFMPGKAGTLLGMLGVEEGKRGLEEAKWGVDRGYGVPVVPVGTGAWDSLFPPLPVEK